jgi:predicted small integral membrane protein
MWMSKEWNGVPDAFRFFVTILMVLIYLVVPDRAADP